MGIAACGPAGGIFRRLEHQLAAQHQRLLRTLARAVEQAGIGRQRSGESTPCNKRFRVDLQRLAVQRDRPFVVAGLADTRVIGGALQDRLRWRRRCAGGTYQGEHDGSSGDRYPSQPDPPCGCARAWCDGSALRAGACDGITDHRLRRGAQLVATATDRADVARPATVIAQRLPEQLHPLADRILADHRRCPDLIGKRVEIDDGVAVGQQAVQQPPTQPADRQYLIPSPHLLGRAVDVQIQQADVLHGGKHRARRVRGGALRCAYFAGTRNGATMALSRLPCASSPVSSHMKTPRRPLSLAKVARRPIEVGSS